ncbi:MAG: hypothetical protein ACFCBW_17085 [Candidatus Competibacterales bacterium]
MSKKDQQESPPFWGVVAKGIIEIEKEVLRFAGIGAIIGALLGAGLGIYLFAIFGWLGVGVGLIAGAVIGGIGVWLMCQLA